MMEFTVKEVTVFRVATIFNKALYQYDFLGIYEVFNITNNANLVC